MCLVGLLYFRRIEVKEANKQENEDPAAHVLVQAGSKSVARC